SRSDGPSDRGADQRDGEHLRGRDERELPPSGAEPRQPAPFGLRVAAQTARGQDRECEQQRGRLTTDQQQSPTRDLSRRVRRSERVDRRAQIERERLGLDLRTGPLDLLGEAVERPRVDVVRTERRSPRVAAIRRGEDGGTCKAGYA